MATKPGVNRDRLRDAEDDVKPIGGGKDGSGGKDGADSGPSVIDGGELTATDGIDGGELTATDGIDLPDDIVIQQAGAPEYPISNGDGTVTLEDGSVIAVGDNAGIQTNDGGLADDTNTGDGSVDNGDDTGDGNVATGDESYISDNYDTADDDDDDDDDDSSDDDDTDDDTDDDDDSSGDDSESTNSSASTPSFGSGSKPDDGDAASDASSEATGGFGSGAGDGSGATEAKSDTAIDEFKDPEPTSEKVELDAERVDFDDGGFDEKSDFEIDIDEKDLDLDDFDEIELID